MWHEESQPRPRRRRPQCAGAHIPDYQVDSVVQFGEGQDNITYEVNGELIVRLSKESDPARRAARVNHFSSTPSPWTVRPGRPLLASVKTDVNDVLPALSANRPSCARPPTSPAYSASGERFCRLHPRARLSLPLIVPPALCRVAACAHVAPAALPAPGAIDEEPAASRS